MTNAVIDSGLAADARHEEPESRKTRWEEIRERLAESRAAIKNRLEPSGDQKIRILRERAKNLAMMSADQADTEEKLSVVEFLLGEERYAIEPAYIRCAFALKTFAPVPCTPSFVPGITNLRGEILSVVDLKEFLGLPNEEGTGLKSILVLQSGAMQFGVAVDSIVGARSIGTSQIKPPSASLAGVHEKCIKGITNDALVILDAVKILTDERAVFQDQA